MKKLIFILSLCIVGHSFAGDSNSVKTKRKVALKDLSALRLPGDVGPQNYGRKPQSIPLSNFRLPLERKPADAHPGRVYSGFACTNRSGLVVTQHSRDQYERCLDGPTTGYNQTSPSNYQSVGRGMVFIAH